MRIPMWLWRWLNKLTDNISASRPPDYIIGGLEKPYLLRWWVLPRNPIFNVYLHHFHRSDDDRALHDHPWWNFSILLDNAYTEHTIAAGGVHQKQVYRFRDVKFRKARSAHRVELHAGRCVSLFITGPKLRSWGFHCPNGWRHWRDYVAPGAKGQIGRGCD